MAQIRYVHVDTSHGGELLMNIKVWLAFLVDQGNGQRNFTFCSNLHISNSASYREKKKKSSIGNSP